MRNIPVLFRANVYDLATSSEIQILIVECALNTFQFQESNLVDILHYKSDWL